MKPFIPLLSAFSGFAEICSVRSSLGSVFALFSIFLRSNSVCAFHSRIPLPFPNGFPQRCLPTFSVWRRLPSKNKKPERRIAPLSGKMENVSRACKPSSVWNGHLSTPAVTSPAHAITGELDGPPLNAPSLNLAPGGVYIADESPGRW